MKRQRRLDRLRAVDREYQVSELSVSYLRAGIAADPAALAGRGLRPRDADAFEENLAATYLIRLFGEFEAALRDLWTNGFRRRTEPPTRQLVDGVAARRGVPDPVLAEAHRVRRWRNAVVHEGEEDDDIEFADARSALGEFLAWLPLDW